MKEITSPETFKTCEIAIVKEKLGLLRKTAPNRKNPERKVRLNPKHAPYIEKAIKYLISQKSEPTYEEIRKKAFEFYKEEKEKKIKKYEGIFELKLPKEEAIEIIEDKGMVYD